MEFYRAVVARLGQADASDVIAALALVVATLSFLSNRRISHRALVTSRRAVDVAEQAINSRGRLAGVLVRTRHDQWTARVVNGTDPTVLDRVLLEIESHKRLSPDKFFSRVEHRALRSVVLDPSSLRGVVGPCPPISLTPFESVEWKLPSLEPEYGCCVHVQIKAADALDRWALSADTSVGYHQSIYHSQWWGLMVIFYVGNPGDRPGDADLALPEEFEGTQLSDWMRRLRRGPD